MKKLTGKARIGADRDDSAQLVADLYGVTADYVRKILRGERTNLAILKTYRTYVSAKRRLVADLKKTIPK